jgi:hypothetical protein
MGKEVPEWATGLLIAGADSPSLRILAGFTGEENHFEICQYLVASFQEIGLEFPEKSRAVIDYALELAETYLAGKLDLKHFLDDICCMHFEFEFCLGNQKLFPLVLLKWAWDDLQFDDIGSYYVPGIHRDNFTAMANQEIQTFIETNSAHMNNDEKSDSDSNEPESP